MGKILQFVKANPEHAEAEAVLLRVCAAAEDTELTTPGTGATDDDDAFDEAWDRGEQVANEAMASLTPYLGTGNAAQLIAQAVICQVGNEHGAAAMVGVLCEVLRHLDATYMQEDET